MIDVINNITTYEDTYYSFGEYIYNIIQPNITGNLDMFKYILGKFYWEYLFPI